MTTLCALQALDSGGVICLKLPRKRQRHWGGGSPGIV